MSGQTPAQADAADDHAGELARLRARADAGDRLIRETLESLCRRDGVPLESSVTPGEPARNYELADRLGVGHVFGMQPQPAAPAGPQGEIRTCYCGTTATAVPGTFPHPDCDGSVQRGPAPELDVDRVFAEWWDAKGYDQDRRFDRFELAYAFGAGAQAWSMVELDREPRSAPEPGTALYLSAIARLSAGLRDVQHACKRGDAPGSVERVAAAALADVNRLQLPQPQPAPVPSALGLKHAATSNRLGYALAALREIAEPHSDEFPRDTARNALDDDAAIRGNVALTREPQPGPGEGKAGG